MHLFLELSQFVALAFVSGLWQGLAMIVVVAVCLHLLPPVSPSIRFAIWGFAFVLMAILPLVHFPVVAAAGHASAPAAGLHLGIGWAMAIAAIWGLCTSVRLIQLWANTVQLRQIRRRAKPVLCQYQSLEILQQQRGHATLCTSVDVDSPSVIGFFAPRLLIPEWMFANLSSSELRQVVLHECEHLRRRDDWMNLLQKIVLALFPLNPALRWLDRRLGLERELACDAGVVASAATPFDYANCLTRLAEQRMVRRRLPLSLSAWGSQSELASRVKSLLRPMHTMPRLYAAVLTALLGVSVAAASIEMARVPRLVAFDAAVAPSHFENAAVGTSPSARAVSLTQAAYHPAGQRHPYLLPIAPPNSTTRPSSRLPAHAKNQPLPTDLSGVPTQQLRPQARLELTKSRQQTGKTKIHPATRNDTKFVYAIDIDFSHSYAAVPFANGWLFVQL